jgi:ribose 5-phosphate isomerase RpiB
MQNKNDNAKIYCFGTKVNIGNEVAEVILTGICKRKFYSKN